MKQADTCFDKGIRTRAAVESSSSWNSVAFDEGDTCSPLATFHRTAATTGSKIGPKSAPDRPKVSPGGAKIGHQGQPKPRSEVGPNLVSARFKVGLSQPLASTINTEACRTASTTASKADEAPQPRCGSDVKLEKLDQPTLDHPSLTDPS